MRSAVRRVVTVVVAYLMLTSVVGSVLGYG